MANFFDNDILMTQTSGNLLIDLACGYGQPSVTTVHLKKNDGTTQVLCSFDNSVSAWVLGSIGNIKYNSIEIHTTINDIRDNKTEELDISLEVVVYESNSSRVSTKFTSKTKGSGSVFNVFYTVTVL